MSRLNMARKIRDNHQNNNNSKDLDYYQQQIKEKNNEKQYIMAKMVDAYGKKGNYHLNEYNIEYLPGVSMLENNNQKNAFRIRNIKHNNSKIHKGNDLININYLKEQFNENNNNRRRGKSSYRPTNLNNENINRDVKIVKYIDNKNEKNNEEEVNIMNNNVNKTDNLYYTFDNNNNNNFPTNINNYFMSFIYYEF